MTAPSQPIQQVKLAELKPYHRQSQLFANAADSEIELLAADMAQRGLKNPIQILPDGTIVCGHCRVRAAQLLQWETIDAVVLQDLADTNAAVIEQHVILDNYARRQLRPLERARCAYRLRELIHGGDFDDLSHDQQNDVHGRTRDRVGEIMGMSGRHAERLMAILDAPLPVQQAYDDRKLTLATAFKIARAQTDVQRKIAQGIESGEEPKKVAKEHLRKTREPTDQETVFRQLIRALSNAETALRSGLADLKIVDVDFADSLEILRHSGSLLAELIEHVERRRREQSEAFDRKLETVTDHLEVVGTTSVDE